MLKAEIQHLLTQYFLIYNIILKVMKIFLLSHQILIVHDNDVYNKDRTTRKKSHTINWMLSTVPSAPTQLGWVSFIKSVDGF